MILLAVALFGALYVAVTGSDRGNKGGSNESLDSTAAAVVQNAGLIEQTIQRAMLVDNVPAHGFNLVASSALNLNNTTTTNTNCTSAECRIFSRTGGKIGLPDLPAAAVGIGTPVVQFFMIRMINVGTTATDLAMVYRYLSPEFCAALNRILNNGVDSTLAQEAWEWTPDTASTTYTGTLTALPTGYAILGNQMSSLQGKKAYCFRLSSGTEYNFVYVILER